MSEGSGLTTAPDGVSEHPLARLFAAENSVTAAIISGIAEGFFALDSQWRFVSFNPAAEEIFGLTRSDVIGRLLWEVSPTIIGTEFERRYRLVMSERTKQTFQTHSALLPDQFHEVRAFPVGDGIGVSFRDVTHNRKINQELHDREAQLARVQRVGRVGGMEVNLRDEFPSRRSPEYLDLHGLPANAAYETHRDWVGRLHPEDRVPAERHLLDVIAGSDTHYTAEYRIVRPSDGVVRWIRAVAEIERDDSGRALKLVGAHLGYYRTQRGGKSGAGERRTATLDHRRAPAANFIRRQGPTFSFRQPTVRVLVRATS